MQPRVKPGVSVRKIKTDDQRSSLDIDSPDEESRGMTPGMTSGGMTPGMTPVTPVEGKRVVAKQERPAVLKANGGSMEPSSLDKLQVSFNYAFLPA